MVYSYIISLFTPSFLMTHKIFKKYFFFNDRSILIFGKTNTIM